MILLYLIISQLELTRRIAHVEKSGDLPPSKDDRKANIGLLANLDMLKEMVSQEVKMVSDKIICYEFRNNHSPVVVVDTLCTAERGILNMQL